VNIGIPSDLVRRTIEMGLDAEMETPFKRQFKSDPLAMIARDRGRHVAAILCIARAYLGLEELPAGLPSPVFMSFRRWSRLVRDSLIWLGQADPAESTNELVEEDPYRETRRQVFAALAGLDNIEHGYSAERLSKLAQTDPDLYDALAKVAKHEQFDKIDGNRLGQWFRHNRGKRVGNLKLEKIKDTNPVKWTFNDGAH
jgi:putative DNA primase/helicase